MGIASPKSYCHCDLGSAPLELHQDVVHVVTSMRLCDLRKRYPFLVLAHQLYSIVLTAMSVSVTDRQEEGF
jgi:hypothetical protein